MKRIISLLLIVLAVFSCKNEKELEKGTVMEPNVYGFVDEGMEIVRDTIKSGEAFSIVMERYGVNAAITDSLLRCADSLFDVRKFRAGNVIEAYFRNDSTDNTAKYVIYHQDRLTSTVFSCRDSIAAWNYTKPVSHERKISDVTIKNSLWTDMVESGASPALIMDLADIYQWSVNFFALQQNDRFRIIYTQSVCEDEIISIDTVFFSLYNGADGKEVAAMRYDIGKGYGKYWGKNGEGMKKLFLKAPLKYNRISSRFSYHRKHPITGKVRAHTAVDYAAPTGTPVHALGDGKITLCGWDPSGGGNRIKIKHPMGYETCYMHLSKFAKGIKAGVHVTQGQLIGYVGSTGRSTGPHLDFRIWQNGKPLDPLKVSSPNTEPLPKQYLDDFNVEYEKYIQELNGN